MSLGGFTTPVWFLLLAVVAALAAGYVWMQRRRRRHTLRFANLAMLERVAPRSPGWRRHVPAALLLVALIALTFGLTGPTADQRVPRNRATVMLVIDVSLSMEATDVTPSRLVAAKEAATRFVDNLRPGINLGLVSFAGSATVLVSPTTDRAQVREGIANLKLAEATATGEAIFATLQAIETFGQLVSSDAGPPPARIVLLTDGKQTIPRELDGPRGAYTAAEMSKESRVPISTISFGTQLGSVVIEGQRQPVPVDDESMQRISEISGGAYYKAANLQELTEVYDELAEQIGYQIRRSDASKPWFVLGTSIAILSLMLAFGLGQRVP